MTRTPSVLDYHPKFSPLRADTAVRVANPSDKDLWKLSRIALAAEEFPEILQIKSNKERHDYLNVKIRELARDIRERERTRPDIHKRLARLDQMHAAFDAVVAWVDAGVSLERPDKPTFRELRSAISRGENLWYTPDDKGAADAALAFEKEIFCFAETFVVEHDWASAFGASDMKDAPFTLPYDVCAFEFKFSGRPVIAFATQLETSVYFSTALGGPEGWLLPDFSIRVSEPQRKGQGHELQDVFGKISDQIRAICIALEAEVARSDVVREPYLKERGRNTFMPERSYHVVSLARRQARPLVSSGSTIGRRVRLHFRRGHWRHFESHKTWIKWMLVGDPELGFIEKHYRL